MEFSPKVSCIEGVKVGLEELSLVFYQGIGSVRRPLGDKSVDCSKCM